MSFVLFIHSPRYPVVSISSNLAFNVDYAASVQLLCYAFTPLLRRAPSSQMKQLERKDGGNKASLRDPARSERMREALKMKYVMGVEAAGGGRCWGLSSRAGQGQGQGQGRRVGNLRPSLGVAGGSKLL